MSKAGVSGHLRAVAEDLQSETFFLTQYASKRRICRTRAGSRPGESLADMVFGFIYHEVLKKIREEVREARLTEPMNFDGECSLWRHDSVTETWLTDSTWADDTAFLTRAADPELLLLRASRLATVVFDTAKRHAMEPNLKKGKTELMVCLRGTNSARRPFDGSG